MDGADVTSRERDRTDLKLIGRGRVVCGPAFACEKRARAPLAATAASVLVGGGSAPGLVGLSLEDVLHAASRVEDAQIASAGPGAAFDVAQATERARVGVSCLTRGRVTTVVCVGERPGDLLVVLDAAEAVLLGSYRTVVSTRDGVSDACVTASGAVCLLTHTNTVEIFDPHCTDLSTPARVATPKADCCTPGTPATTTGLVGNSQSETIAVLTSRDSGRVILVDARDGTCAVSLAVPAHLSSENVCANAAVFLNPNTLAVGYSDPDSTEPFVVMHDLQDSTRSAFIENPLDFPEEEPKPWNHQFFLCRVAGDIFAIFDNWTSYCTLMAREDNVWSRCVVRDVRDDDDSPTQVVGSSVWEGVDRPIVCLVDESASKVDNSIYIVGAQFVTVSDIPLPPFYLKPVGAELEGEPSGPPCASFALLTTDGTLEIVGIACTGDEVFEVATTFAACEFPVVEEATAHSWLRPFRNDPASFFAVQAPQASTLLRSFKRDPAEFAWGSASNADPLLRPFLCDPREFAWGPAPSAAHPLRPFRAPTDDFSFNPEESSDEYYDDEEQSYTEEEIPPSPAAASPAAASPAVASARTPVVSASAVSEEYDATPTETPIARTPAAARTPSAGTRSPDRVRALEQRVRELEMELSSATRRPTRAAATPVPRRPLSKMAALSDIVSTPSSRRKEKLVAPRDAKPLVNLCVGLVNEFDLCVAQMAAEDDEPLDCASVAEELQQLSAHARVEIANDVNAIADKLSGFQAAYAKVERAALLAASQLNSDDDGAVDEARALDKLVDVVEDLESRVDLRYARVRALKNTLAATTPPTRDALDEASESARRMSLRSSALSNALTNVERTTHRLIADATKKVSISREGIMEQRVVTNVAPSLRCVKKALSEMDLPVRSAEEEIAAKSFGALMADARRHAVVASTALVVSQNAKRLELIKKHSTLPPLPPMEVPQPLLLIEQGAVVGAEHVVDAGKLATAAPPLFAKPVAAAASKPPAEPPAEPRAEPPIAPSVAFATPIAVATTPPKEDLAKKLEDSTLDVRTRLRTFYALHNPGKTESDIDSALRKYAGKEGDMFKALEKKYSASSGFAAAPSGGFAASGSFGAFGAASPATFGAAASPGAFGSTASPATFGAAASPTIGAFGSPAPAATGGFGAAPSSGGFGGAQNTSGFNAPSGFATQPSFGAPGGDLAGLLTQFYQKHNPSKLGSVPSTAQKYAGRESALWESLLRKYPGSVVPSGAAGGGGGGFAAAGGGFGQPTSGQPTSGFGQPASGLGQPTSGFGQPSSGFATSSGFGQPQQQTTGGFGGGGFGQSSFGQPTSFGQSSFGQTGFATTQSPPQQGGFGSFATTGNAFGSSVSPSQPNFQSAAFTTMR